MDFQSQVALATVAAGVIYFWYKRRSHHPLPPGPPSLPIIGSALSIPREKEWLLFTKWAKVYGPMVYFKVLGKEFVVLNSKKAITDLLQNRGAIYSNRPSLEMFSDLTGYDKIMAFLPYNDRLVNSRKLLAPFLAPRGLHRWYPTIDRASHLLMAQLLDEPLDLYKHILFFTGTIILKISHGYVPSLLHDPLLAQAEQTVADIGSAFELGQWWIEFFPWLRYVPAWFPGAGWKRKVNGFKKNLMTMVDIPHNMVKERMRDGTAQSSFTSEMLEQPGGTNPEQEELIKWTSHVLYAGGIDTSVSAMESVFLVMTMFPEIQQKCQEELDRVVGHDRLPSAADRINMPYLSATCKEVLRWHPVAPIALPHAVMEDDVYGGYFIPKGAVVWANSWLLLHDEEVYPDPYKFDPERFLGLNPQQDPRENGCFGYGRRKCPALDFADATLFSLAAIALATFKIQRQVDEKGNEIVPSGEYEHRIMSHPLPFPFKLVPRSKAVVDMIRHSVEA